ncbi:MAG: FtsB family cell division protein [Marinirhabdus sp.]
MKLSRLKKRPWFKFFGNTYVLILLLFIVWMGFFDTNSYFIHKELNDEIDRLEENRDFYKSEIKKDKTFIQKMSDSDAIEKFAREKYYLKKENEDIYIIQHQDSVP